MIDALPPPPMNVARVARYLGRSVPSIYRLLRSGKLHGVKVGGIWCIPVEAVQELLREEIQVD